MGLPIVSFVKRFRLSTWLTHLSPHIFILVGERVMTTSPSKFQLYNTVLSAVVTELYIFYNYIVITGLHNIGTVDIWDWIFLCWGLFSSIVVVQLLHWVWLFATSWTAACQAPLFFTISWSLLRFLESLMLSNHLILCCPLLLLPSIFLSIRVFSSESALCIRWPKYGSFSISPSNEYSGLISFRIDWLYILQSKGLSRFFSNTTV